MPEKNRYITAVEPEDGMVTRLNGYIIVGRFNMSEELEEAVDYNFKGGGGGGSGSFFAGEEGLLPKGSPEQCGIKREVMSDSVIMSCTITCTL